MIWFKYYVDGDNNMTPHQEGIWVRLLKLSAKYGKDCGYGNVGINENLGFFPDQLAHMMGITISEWGNIAQFFVSEGMITTRSNGVIVIHKWKHYQGEYLRLRDWKRKRERKNETPSETPKKEEGRRKNKEPKELTTCQTPTTIQLEKWSKAYPTIDIQAEWLKAQAWLAANTHRPKKRPMAFFNNWLARCAKNVPVKPTPRVAVAY